MTTLMFFEPEQRRWTPRRRGSSSSALQLWDPWSALLELDRPLVRPLVHSSRRSKRSPAARSRRVCRHGKTLGKEVQTVREGPQPFQLTVDTAGYRPDELSVKLSPDGFATVRAQHREESESGIVTSSMIRSVRLPEDVDSEALTSRLTQDGRLILEAPATAAGEKKMLKDERNGEKAADGMEVELARGEEAAPEESEFRYEVNVSDFQPEEVSVRVDGGMVTVEAEHEEETDHGASSHRLVRRFALPAGVNPDHVTSRRTRSGQLVVQAPVKPPAAIKRGQVKGATRIPVEYRS